MSAFWTVSAPSEDGDAWVSRREDDLGDMMELIARIRDGERLQRPLPIAVTHHGAPADLLFTGGLPYIVASDRLVGVLTDLGTTGWIAAPVTMKGYHLLVVTGRCADFRAEWDDDDADDPESVPVDVSIGWDGSDVFWREARERPHVPEPSSAFIVTDEVRRAMLDAGLRVEYETPVN